jgi:hypothetical protein
VSTRPRPSGVRHAQCTSLYEAKEQKTYHTPVRHSIGWAAQRDDGASTASDGLRMRPPLGAEACGAWHLSG